MAQKSLLRYWKENLILIKENLYVKSCVLGQVRLHLKLHESDVNLETTRVPGFQSVVHANFALISLK